MREQREDEGNQNETNVCLYKVSDELSDGGNAQDKDKKVQGETSQEEDLP